MKRSLWNYLPHKARGQHRVIASMWQLVGGKRWSLVLMWNIEHVKPEERVDAEVT